MHSTILFLSKDNAPLDIGTLTAEDIGMSDIAWYIDDKIEVPDSIKGFKVSEDHSITFTLKEIENHFAERCIKFRKEYSNILLSDFCSLDEYTVGQLIEQTNDVYVVYIGNGAENMEYAVTFDSFLRTLYRLRENSKFYIVGCLGYKLK